MLFDLDGTLLPAPSAEALFVLRSLQEGRLGARALAHSLAFAAQQAPRFGRHVWKKNKAYLAGLSTAQVAAWAEPFVDEVLLPRLRPAMLAHLREHLARGDAVALLTGAPEFLAEPLCRRLGIPHCVATACAAGSGRYRAAPPERHVFGAEKLELAQALAARLGTPLGRAWAYADSIHDAALLAAVGHAVAVHPDRALRRLALRSGWSVQPAVLTI